MKSFKLLLVLTAGSFALTACSPGPLSDTEVQQALNKVVAPAALISFELENREEEGSESDSYVASYDTSSICNSVAEIGQLTYQSGFGGRNKQSLPPELRSFEVRKGIKLSDNFKDDEYLTFYLTLLSFESSEAAEDFAAPLKAAVKSCGDVSGSIETRTTIKYSELSGTNDFSHHIKSVFELFSFSVKDEQFDYLVQKGALVALVYVGASEDGLNSAGFTTKDIDEISKDLIRQVLP